MHQKATIIDTHAHLDGSQFNQDREETIARAFENGISHILNIGCELESSRAGIALAERYPQIYAAVGFHPHDATDVDSDSLTELEELLGHPKVVALGEIGLDYFRDHSPRDIQRSAFRKQLQLARKTQKPIIIHDRDAHDEVMEIMMDEKASEVGGVLHCFSGNLDMAHKCLDLGFHLSFPGQVTYPKNEELREIVKAVPVERMLLETDCPYLAPQKFRGKRNEPAYVRLTAEKIAEVKQISFEELARITTDNCQRLFGFGLI